MTVVADLNPCNLCGSTPEQAPEGVDYNGNPRWTYLHCWKCGYRPAGIIPDDSATRYAMFQRWYDAQTAADLAKMQAEVGPMGLTNVPPAVGVTK